MARSLYQALTVVEEDSVWRMQIQQLPINLKLHRPLPTRRWVAEDNEIMFL
jgi:hypothetical protein